MLHRRRKRLEELAKQETAGATFWTGEFDRAARTKVLHAFKDATGDYLFEYCSRARDLILRDEGLMHLVRQDMNEANDLLNYLLTCSNDMMPTVIEAMMAATRDNSLTRNQWDRRDASSGFGVSVATILREHRVNYDLIDGQMIEFSSREMHEAVTAPMLALLAGRRDLANAERAYQDALEEISKGKPEDAITDAGTALQEALQALGCSGNALGPLIKSAKSAGLLAPHDGPLLDAVERVAHWVSADRSESGDSHGAATATVDDAWFIVHVVGALVLRLGQGGPRSARG